MRPTLLYVPTSGRVLAVATGTTALVAGVAAALTTPRDAPAVLLAAAFVAVALWAAYWRPAVEVSDGGVLVRNVLRTVHVPWPTYRGVEARLALVVRHSEGRVTAWAAPAGGVRAARRAARREDDAAGDRAGDRPVTGVDDGRVHRVGTADARGVADAIAGRHAALLAEGHLDGADRAVSSGAVRPESRWHVRTVAALVVLAAATAAAIGT